MEGLGHDDREIPGLDTDTVVQRAAQFCQVKDQESLNIRKGLLLEMEIEDDREKKSRNRLGIL